MHRAGDPGRRLQIVRGTQVVCVLLVCAVGWAHKHRNHVCDTGGVQDQRLVEVRRELPRGHKQGINGAGRAAGHRKREVARNGAVHAQRAGRGCATVGAGRGVGAAHEEEEAHVRDPGRVPAQRLIEGPRTLCREGRASRGLTHSAGRTSADREAGGGERSREVRPHHVQAKGERLQIGRGGGAPETSWPCS